MLPNLHVLAGSSMAFQVFSVCLLHILRSTTGRWTCFRLLRRRLLLFRRVLWPFFQQLLRAPAVLCMNLTARFPVWLFGPVSSVVFPALFPAFVSSSALDVARLFFFSCRYIEIAAFLCLPSRLFLSPQALARPFLVRWFGAPIIASYVFPAFLYTAKVWSESCNRLICLA